MRIQRKWQSPWATILLVLVPLAGCVRYTTPGAGVQIPALIKTDKDIAEVMQVEPAAMFPARLAIARVQASGYRSDTNQCFGTGRYCVITTRDIESDTQMERLRKLPQVAGLAPLSRLLLPTTLDSIKDLRLSAAQLKADILMVYTLDTGFSIDSTSLGPLSLVTLGFLPNQKAKVTTTASAVFYDVRTEFTYGVAESTTTESQRASMWATKSAIDGARLRAEKAAFERLVEEVEKIWGDIVAAHGDGGKR